MKKLKKMLAVFLSAIMILFTSIVSTATSEYLTLNQSQYEEMRDQINFDCLSVIVVDSNEVIVDVDSEISFFDKLKAKNQKEKFDEYIKRYPKTGKYLIEVLKSGENLCAMSYTVAPVVFKEDHFERVKKKSNKSNGLQITANAAVGETGDTSFGAKNNFQLCTMVIKSGDSNPDTYIAMTLGTWDTGTTIIGGKNRPSYGEDYVLQACPNVTSKSEFGCDYNYKTSGSTTGQEGTHFFRRDGADSWVKYGVIDDPVGRAQLKDFALTQTFIAKVTSETKKINSYYVHTWKSMDISVSVSGEAGSAGGIPAYSVGLTITPTIVDRSWQIYNSVSYNW